MQASQKSKVKSQKFAKRGFSLMELLIVIAIVVVMTGVVFANRNSGRVESSIDAASRQIAAQLRALQNEALNGKQIAGKNACQYVFSAVSASSYSVSYKECVTANLIAGAQNTDITNRKTNFDGALVSVSFSSPRGTADSAKSIALKSTIDGTVKRWICVSADGVIAEQKTACL